MKQEYDIIVNWPNGHLDKLKMFKGVPLKAFPLSFNYRKGKVGILQNGILSQVFKIKKISRNCDVVVPSSKQKGSFKKVNGNLLHWDKLTIKTTNRKIKIAGFHAYGAFRYYDLKNDLPVTISNTRLHDRSVYVEHFDNLVDDTFFAKKYVKGFVSKDRSPAEQRLVDAYVSYCKIDESVVYCYFPTDKTYSDLFDRSKWRLIEAKAIADRRAVRQAIGQLLDYKRFFSRTPSIGVLLPEKPTQTTIELLKHYNITAIWASGLKFKDSSSGNWTTKRIKK